MIKNFANLEFLKGDMPIAAPIRTARRVFVSIKILINTILLTCQVFFRIYK